MMCSPAGWDIKMQCFYYTAPWGYLVDGSVLRRDVCFVQSKEEMPALWNGQSVRRLRWGPLEYYQHLWHLVFIQFFLTFSDTYIKVPLIYFIWELNLDSNCTFCSLTDSHHTGSSGCWNPLHQRFWHSWAYFFKQLHGIFL